MTDDQHGPGHGHGQDNGQDQGAPQGGSRWDPLPQGDYDDGATAFVKLPEGGIDAFLAARGDSPLAAPGHGYVPPQIAVAPPEDPSATWAAPAGAGDWPAPQGTPQTVGDDRFAYHPGATGQWTFNDPSAPPGAPHSPHASGHDVTGQWSIPVAGGDLPDESGEFTTSSLVEQWGGTPPATLPGGAAAPWATGAPDPADGPWGPHPDEAGRQPADQPPFGHAQEHTPPHGSAAHTPHDPAAAERDRRAAPEHTEPHASGTYAPEISPEAYTVAPDGSAEAARRAAGAEESAEPARDPGHAQRAVHAPAEASRGPAEPAPEAAAVPADAHAPADAPEDAPAPDGAPGEPGTVPEPDTAPEADPQAQQTPAAAAAAEAPDDAPPPFHEEHPLAAYVLRVNGSDRPVADAWIGESLLYVLRERLGLAGAKDGCSQGECGACNVQVDGRLVASCLVPAVTTAGSEIRTVEGLAVDGQPSDVQRALARCGAVQCGFCVPGMAMTVHDLLEGNPAPTELEARQALCGNLCRCSGYRGVLRAVQDVVAEREAHAAADAETDGDEARIPHQAGPGGGGVHVSAFENPAQPHPHDPAYGQGQDGGQA
ncbi:2Fe-2S iron-sulfur cluster-binding protein [Streptomyces rishiriensis]|uniref:2Fe-2S iron-sulfur cluster-binding protein n=1 Tax=Streptomyces rishiriensis TaxID=68264 RepID=UPI000D58D8F1|nr:2Fe-2S iron-sulfur cluster-binding protein [Streptomyces rishiriensis]